MDVQDSQAVQLVQGAVGTQGELGDSLSATPRRQEEGASWIHLVDLDAAFGRGFNADPPAGIIGRLDMDIEPSGGIRDDASLERTLGTGYCRANIGTAALERPQRCERIIEARGDRIAIGLDVRGERLAARGRTTEGGPWAKTFSWLAAAGCRRFAVTDANSDGMFTNPNPDLLDNICVRTDAAAIASGSISALDDLRTPRELTRDDVEEVIIGTALYLERLTLAETIEIVDLRQIGRVV